ncbi:MAG: TlpA disulfide reductase family protein [Chlorobium sp.]|jgi:peroxiredoxin
MIAGTMQMVKRVLSGPAVFAAALMVLFMTCSAGAAQAPLAPAFSAVGMDGKTVSSRQLAGKAYIVNFFASWCPPCRSEIPDMVQLQNTYKAKGFTFVGVAVNESDETIKSFMKSNGISYPVVMADQKLVGAYGRYVEGGIRSIPTSFVVNRSGRIVQIVSGARSKAVFEKMILDALRPVKAVK